MSYAIRNNEEQGLGRLPSQFDDSPTLRGYLGEYLKKADEVQTLTEEVLAGLRIDTAVGAQLDNIGKLVGEPRFARLDVDYRIAIKTRIVLNTSQGTPSDIYSAAKALSGSDTVRIWEHYPASVIVSVGNEDLANIPNSLASNIDEAAPAGVSVDQVLIDTKGGGLVFAEIVFETGTIETSDGSDLVNDQGDFIGYQTVSSSTTNTQNARFAEILVDQLHTASGDTFLLNGEPWIVSSETADSQTGNIFFEVI